MTEPTAAELSQRARDREPGSHSGAPPQNVHALMNNPTADKKAKQHLSKINKLKAERGAINAKIAAERKALYAMGHVRDAVALQERISAMDEEQRQSVDLSLLHLRRASGIAVQSELIEAASAGPRTH